MQPPTQMNSSHQNYYHATNTYYYSLTQNITVNILFTWQYKLKQKHITCTVKRHTCSSTANYWPNIY